MELPEYITALLDKLEEAGCEAWVVGGCVRDGLLGIQPKDYDICTSALPDRIREVFRDRDLSLTGLKHGTVVVILPEEDVEITTYRTEGGYTDNRHPDWVEFVEDLEQDLRRRDFTVNAMAYSPRRGLRDPFGGEADLRSETLRTVGNPADRFREDSLRILRGMRFCMTYHLTPEPDTGAAMQEQRALLDNLARERVYDELCKLLPEITAEGMLRFGPILGQVIPELEPMIGFDQCSPHHAYDLYTHVAQVTSKVDRSLEVRWAALLHDIGKIPTFSRDETGRGHFYCHAAVGAAMAREVLHRLHAPAALTERAVLLIANHMARMSPDRKLLRRQISRLGFEAVEQLLSLQAADMSSKGIDEPLELENFPRALEMVRRIRQEGDCLFQKDLAVNGSMLMELGLKGGEVGAVLRALLNLVMEDQLPNRQEVLLDWVKREIGAQQ